MLGLRTARSGQPNIRLLVSDAPLIPQSHPHLDQGRADRSDSRFDGSGNVVEHYSDGDHVNEDTPLGREAAAPNTLYIWGPNIPLGFVTGRVEDAGKPFPMPPDVVAGVPAQISAGGA